MNARLLTVEWDLPSTSDIIRQRLSVPEATVLNGFAFGLVCVRERGHIPTKVAMTGDGQRW